MAKKVTIGYDYYVGMHFILCHGPVDTMIRIRVDERDAAFGPFPPGRHRLVNPELFGGRDREGGIVGYIDFETGHPNQGQNAYLLEHIGGPIPAYRGVAGIVFNQMNMGMNPYLKPWAFTLQRIHVRTDGVLQWYDEKAEIRTIGRMNDTYSVFIAIEVTRSMDADVEGTDKKRLDIIKQQVNMIIDDLNDWQETNDTSDTLYVGICVFAGVAYTETWALTSESIAEEIKAYINSLTTYASGADYHNMFASASDWFYWTDNNLFFIISYPDYWNQESIANTANYFSDMINRKGNWAPPYDVDIYAFSIDYDDTQYAALLDNTSIDSVPVIKSADQSTALHDAIYYAVTGVTAAMNPAHIIRECLTDKVWGMGYLDLDIDSAAFTYAADKLWNEKLGMNIIWDSESTVEEFIKLVLRHIDASLFVDRSTGQFVLKLIRNDYDPNTLLVLNPDNVSSISDFSKPGFGELPNCITVTYPDERANGVATITIQDIALVQQQGAVINVSVDYPGITESINASKCGQRDLKVLSTPLISCTIVTNRIAENLNLGSVFKLTWPDYELNEIIMRVTAITFGDGKNNKIRITCVQDVFTFPDTAFIVPNPPDWIDPVEQPALITTRTVFEVPYLQIVQEVGQTAIDAILGATNNPDAGYVGAAAVRPSSGQIKAQIWTDAGAGYRNVSALDYCPGAVLDQDINRMATTFNIKNVMDAVNITLGSWVQVGTHELMSVVSITTNSITVKRAVLDTVPLNHIKGEFLIFWDNISDSDPTEYVASDFVHVKLTSVTGKGSMPVASVPDDTVTLRSRAIRPYPPANVKINNLYFPTGKLDVIVLTWVERNRTQQTGTDLLGFTDATITPEPGTTYRVVVRDGANTVIHDMPGITEVTYTIPTPVMELMSGTCTIELSSVRDTYESYYYHNIPVSIAVNSGKLPFIMDETSGPINGSTLNFIMES